MLLFEFRKAGKPINLWMTLLRCFYKDYLFGVLLFFVRFIDYLINSEVQQETERERKGERNREKEI